MKLYNEDWTEIDQDCGNHMDLFTEDWGEIGKDRVFSSVTRPRTGCS